MRALVTGGVRGIGAGIARALAGDGWEVVGARGREQVEAVAEEIGGRWVQVDVEALAGLTPAARRKRSSAQTTARTRSCSAASLTATVGGASGFTPLVVARSPPRR